MSNANTLKGFSDAVSELISSTAARVIAVDGRDWGGSSGIIIRPGVAVTAEEALDREDEIEVTLPDGAKANATLAGRDAGTDVAVLKLDRGPSVEAPATASPVRPGHLIAAVGRSPSGVIGSLGTVAFVGDAWRSSHGGQIDALIRADVTLTRATEGGALVDADGGLVGMAVFGPRRRVLAIPTATLLRAADHILAHGTVSRGYIGIGVQPVKVEDDGGQSAAMVVSLDPDGPAKKAGLMLGDIVETWGGEPVTGPRSIVERLGPETVDRTITVGVIRAGSKLTVELQVAPRRPT
jgi:S1-C subfamily serine protease